MSVKYYQARTSLIPRLSPNGTIPVEIFDELFIECRNLDEALWGKLKDRPAFVYGLKVKDGDIFYVGSTIKPIEVRFNDHIMSVYAKTHVNNGLVDYVTKYGADGIEVCLLEEMQEGYRFVREAVWIAKLKTEGVQLVNIANPSKNLVWDKRDRKSKVTQFKLYLLFYKTFELIAGVKPIANHWQELLVEKVRADIPAIVGYMRLYYQALFGEKYFKILYDFATRYIYHPL